ncbi:MAG: TIGR02996 domain-containing protein [Proteobacteria bacterium]|nr:TIGR02996 domain-containing protein [Pseudomonadota bacterium]
MQRAWLDVQADRVLAAYATRYPDGVPEPTAVEARQLAAIERALAAAVPVGGDARRDALLAEVYADPFDDGPRAVLADHLGASDDPRGEFITLQLVPSPTATQTRRMTALLTKHARAWLGPLEKVIAKEGVEFRRGFLAACRVKLKNAMEAERYGHDPSWATVEHLRFTGTRFSNQAFSGQDSGVFAVDPVMKSLRDVNLKDDVDLARLLEHAWPHLERLATSTEHPLGEAGLAVLHATDKLPALVAIEMRAPPKNWLASATFGKRLRHVVLGLAEGRDVASWLPELARLPALETATLHVPRGGEPQTFARDDQHKLAPTRT